jgi:hypothetical protein
MSLNGDCWDSVDKVTKLIGKTSGKSVAMWDEALHISKIYFRRRVLSISRSYEKPRVFSGSWNDSFRIMTTSFIGKKSCSAHVDTLARVCFPKILMDSSLQCEYILEPIPCRCIDI